MLSVEPNPTTQILEEITEWIKKDELLINEVSTVEEAFSSKNLYVLQKDNAAIGYICTQYPDEKGINTQKIIKFVVVGIKASEREKNYGRQFVEKVESILRKKGVVLITLICAPLESHFFWKKCDFVTFPTKNNSSKEMYKVTENHLSPSNIKSENSLTLTDDRGNSTTWNFELRKDNKTLLTPIITYAKLNSHLKIELIIDGFSKKYSTRNFPYNDLDNDDFLVFRSIS